MADSSCTLPSTHVSNYYHVSACQASQHRPVDMLLCPPTIALSYCQTWTMALISTLAAIQNLVKHTIICQFVKETILSQWCLLVMEMELFVGP